MVKTVLVGTAVLFVTASPIAPAQGAESWGRRSWRRTWSTSTGSMCIRSGSGRGTGFFHRRRRRFRCVLSRRGRLGTESSF